MATWRTSLWEDSCSSTLTPLMMLSELLQVFLSPFFFSSLPFKRPLFSRLAHRIQLCSRTASEKLHGRKKLSGSKGGRRPFVPVI